MTAIPPNYGKTDVRDLGELFRTLLTTEFIDLKSVPQAAIVADGREIISLKKFADEYLKAPERRRGTAKAYTAGAFIALVRRFSSEASVVFADPKAEAPSLTAVFDYSPEGGDATKADWHAHRAIYAPRLSDEWVAWKAKNGKYMPQGEFAAFIEERAIDAIVPEPGEKLDAFAALVQGHFATPTELVALSRGLEVNVGSVVKNAARNSSGEISVVYIEQHNDAGGQPIKVPNLFQIAIPVFYAGTRFSIAAWLRYRVASGAITWAYQLVQPEVVFQTAFDDIVGDVAHGIDVDAEKIILGSPEQ